jgi:hypothetical protein
MSDTPSVKRIVMSKTVARAWLVSHAKPEYRFRVFNPNAKDYPSMLRSFRDGKMKLAGVQPLPDLGVKESFDSFFVWSSDYEAMKTLHGWFDKHGLETSWIW